MKIFGLYISRTDWKTRYAEAELARQDLEGQYRKVASEAWFYRRQDWDKWQFYKDSTNWFCSAYGCMEVIKLYLHGSYIDKEKLLKWIDEIEAHAQYAKWTREHMNECFRMFNGWDRKKLERIQKILNE